MPDNKPLTFGELFAGIGGFSLGFERAGMKCAWQVEIDPYATAVLRKQWPDVPKHEDVRTFPPPCGNYAVDLICGGFPCQDISLAGHGAGLAGERSGLWYEFARIVGVLRPKYVVVENVSALLTRGMDAVLGTLSTLGYDAEWHVIPASAVGAPHRRERVWIVAYPKGFGGWPRLCEDRQERYGDQSGDRGRNVADTSGNGRQGVWEKGTVAGSSGLCGGEGGHEVEHLPEPSSEWWAVEPELGRVAHGVPSRVDRLRCLGNAVVPQVVEVIGRAIIQAEGGE
jgi:DNA (cytosine-5)-methyltransferase 1